MLQDNIRTVGIIPSVQSDHSAMILKLLPTSECTPGRAYWKFNSSLRQDKHFTESLKTEIQAFAREGSSLADSIMRWEYIEYKCREFSRNFSVKMSKERKARRLALEKRLANLEVMPVVLKSTENASQTLNLCTILYHCRNNSAVKVRMV